MKTVVTTDPQFRIVLSKEVRQAAGIKAGEPLRISASPGRIVLEAEPDTRGRVVKRGKLKIWTGKVPEIPLEEAVEKTRQYFR
jgi:bifunctional DNA-binding transcriptional regulator/antitoxin component of YhaV-PrlF toxin-antitoxin module